MFSTILRLLLLLAATACATVANPVPVTGDILALEGTWAGEYEGVKSGRSGSIVFELRSQSDTAFGDVLMKPHTVLQRSVPGDHPGTPGLEPLPAQVLTIAFTRIDRGRVSGTLDPYRDPNCGCQLVTTFTGDLQGDRITGTFISRHQDGSFEQGRWSVRRRSD